MDLELRTFFGRLLYVFLVRLPAAEPLGLPEPTVVLFAAVQRCDTVYQDQDLDIHYYQNMSHTEIIDIWSLKALVGRIPWDGWWAIIDRSGNLARSGNGVDDAEIID